MYIPKSIYTYAPFYWLIVGVLLALLGFRVGSQGGETFQYFAVTLGALSSAWGIKIFLMRRAQQRVDELETLPSSSPPE